ncbi:unnamed protein product [Symbiodinium natans]|uniref:Uncharacterized protein n=1 Tax=Symbiodinium natans TaxID=878477 RepID=A0A812QZ25_9DINO|nr:unnamed protein product [Symbiodinium natans]
MSASGSQPIPQPSTPTTPTAPIPTQEEVNAEVRELIYKFGSHVCMDAVLGGYWRIDAKYQSTTTKDRVQVDNIVSKAITQAESDSWSFGISASVATADNASGAASGGAGSSSDNSGSTDNTNGNSQASGTESKDTKLTIEQSWKGGAAGTNPGDWRKSLAAAFSSNWRVIDHVLPKCVGIWEFVDDDATKTALCNGWLDLYLDGPTKSITSRINDTVREKACESTLNMNALRTQAQNLIRLETDARDRLERQRCAEDKVFSRFWIKADKVRNGGTAAELAGIRFGLNKETSLSTTAQMYSFYTGTPSIVAGFPNDAKQSITDFSYKLSAAGSSKDPIQFTIYGQEDAGPTVKLLTYQMDPDIQLLTNISDGQTNFYRQAYSEWIPVQGASKGFIWDETEEVCRPKRCFCTDKDGKVQPGNPGPICTSPDGSLDCDTCCPTADRQKCGESDLAAQCPSLGKNYKLLDPNTRFEPCRAGKCTIDVDGFKCCRDVTYAKSFNVEIRTPKGNDCGTDSTVQVRMNVATPDGTIYLGGWSHDLGIRKGPNFDQGMIDSFTLNIAGLAGLNVPVKPVYICFRLTGNDEWCIDWVKIYNADLPSEYQVGDQIKGWDERFKSTSVWCKYLTYT